MPSDGSASALFAGDPREATVIAQQLAALLLRCSKDDRVWEAKPLMPSPELSRALGDRSGEHYNGNAHRSDSLTRIAEAPSARKRHQRLAVCTRGRKQLPTFPVSRFHVVDRASMMGVSRIQQPDQDACVEDQRFHSSRSRSSSPSS